MLTRLKVLLAVLSGTVLGALTMLAANTAGWQSVAQPR
jgi:hypothetical protein